VTLHAPALQTRPDAHAWSVVFNVEHIPQFALSVCTSWHLPSVHNVVPAKQLTAHAPALHTCPLAQVLSLVPGVEHPPQFALSVCKS
jgi:hypothetical protein